MWKFRKIKKKNQAQLKDSDCRQRKGGGGGGHRVESPERISACRHFPSKESLS